MPLLDLFFSMLWFFLFFMWIMLVFRVFADIFRSDDLGGVAKTLWILFVIFFVFLGVFVYVIARGQKMTEHSINDAQKQNEMFASYVRETAGTSSSTADELAKLASLRDAGTITGEDFEKAKAKALA